MKSNSMGGFMHEEIELKGENFSLLIIILGYENTNASELSDASWLTCEIKLEISGLLYINQVSFLTDDFIYFSNAITQLFLSTGEFKLNLFDSYEEYLMFNATKTHLGKIQIDGKIKNNNMPSINLEFTFNTDNGLLLETKKQLRNFLARLDSPDVA